MEEKEILSIKADNKRINDELSEHLRVVNDEIKQENTSYVKHIAKLKSEHKSTLDTAKGYHRTAISEMVSQTKKIGVEISGYVQHRKLCENHEEIDNYTRLIDEADGKRAALRAEMAQADNLLAECVTQECTRYKEKRSTLHYEHASKLHELAEKRKALIADYNRQLHENMKKLAAE